MLEAKPEALEADYLSSPRLSTMSGQILAALQLTRSRLHARSETSPPLLHPCPSAFFFFLDLQAQVWMARTAEVEEQEI